MGHIYQIVPKIHQSLHLTGYHVCKTFGKITTVTYLTIHDLNIICYSHAINYNNFPGIRAEFFCFGSLWLPEG